jgi:hypothetical protein
MGADKSKSITEDQTPDEDDYDYSHNWTLCDEAINHKYLNLLRSADQSALRTSQRPCGPEFIYGFAQGSTLFSMHLGTGAESQKAIYINQLFKSGSAWCEIPWDTIVFSGGWVEIYEAGKDRVFSSEVFAYNKSREQMLTFKPPMLRNRSHHYTCYFKGFIYAIGGFDGQLIEDCERYNWAHDIWEPLPPLPKPTSRGSIIVQKSTLYVIGGARGPRQYTDEVLALDLVALKWSQLDVKLPVADKSLAAFQSATDPSAIYFVSKGFLSRLCLDQGEVLVLARLPKNITSNAGPSYCSRGVIYSSSNDGAPLKISI